MSTYKRVYDEGIEILQGAGISEAKLDGRLLLEYVCNINHSFILTHGDEEMDETKEKEYMELIQKRAERNPLAYITGSQEFMGLEFKVSEDVLIPNQDTETLVEEVLRELSDGMEIMDLCTGSGCIALSLLNFTNDTIAVATDISEKALDIARANADKIGLSERISFVQTDLFPAEERKFDIIVSNPPYIRTSVIEELEPEVKDHEPRLALDGDADGLTFYRRIVDKSAEFLRSSGWLMMEIGYDQGADVSAMMENAGYKDVEVIKDLGGNDRVVRGCLY